MPDADPEIDEPIEAQAPDADLETLARIESELADVEVVLACLESGSDTRCDVCVAAERDGSLAGREALRLCSLSRTAVG